MAESAPNPNLFQYPAPRVPGTWTGERKQFVVWLTEVLDDIYRWRGRLDFTDLGKDVRDWIAGISDLPEDLQKKLDDAMANINGTMAEWAQNLSVNIEGVRSLVLTLEQIQNGTIADVASLIQQLATTDAHIIDIEQTINTVEGELSTKVSESDFFNLAGQVNQNTTEISQNAHEITLKADETYVDTLNGLIQQSGALLQILKTMIGAQVYESTYTSGPITSGDVFPLNPQENDGFIYTGGDYPRFYVYQNGDWWERAAERLVTSGVTIEPDHVAISTPNLQFELTDPNDRSTVLVGITQDGMVFRDRNGQTVFNFNVNQGDLTIAGSVFATEGVIGGFLVDGNTLSKGDFLIDSSGLIRIGPANNPYFSVNNQTTYIGNALMIKPGVLPVTDARPNLYYDNDTGILYRTTWKGTGAALSAVLRVVPEQVTVQENFQMSWQVSGGTPPYTIQWAYVRSGSTLASGTSTNPTGAQTVSAGNTAGAGIFTLNVTDAENATSLQTFNVTVKSPQIQVTVSASDYTCTASVFGGSGSYSYVWYRSTSTSGPWTQVQSGSSATYTLPSNNYGNFILYCDATDNSTGATATSNYSNLARQNPQITVSLSSSGYASVSGGSGSYMYRWYVAAIQTLDWVDYNGGWVSSNSFYMPSGGQMAVRVVVQDTQTGTQASSNMITM
jgi:hypothetical protein